MPVILIGGGNSTLTDKDIALKEQEMSVPKWKICLLSGMAFGANVLFLYLFGDKLNILYSAAVIAESLSFV